MVQLVSKCPLHGSQQVVLFLRFFINHVDRACTSPLLNFKRMIERNHSIDRETNTSCLLPPWRKCPFLTVHVYENTKSKKSPSNPPVNTALCARLAAGMRMKINYFKLSAQTFI